MMDSTAALNLFAGLDLNEAKAATGYFRTVTVAAGAVLFREGDAGDALCVVNSGKISVHKSDREIAIMTKGRAFGEMSVLDGRSRSATCMGAEASSVLMLDEKSLRRMMKEQPTIATKILHALASSLASRLRRADQRLVEVLWGD